MSIEKASVLIDKRLMPDYYPKFHCLGSKCQYNCCQSWNISFSKKDYLAIKRAAKPPELEALTEQGIRRLRGERANGENYAQICLNENGRCPMLNGEGLCRLQLGCGEQTLPEVCRTFPRGSAYTPAGYLEFSCSTGCEEVLNQLYERTAGLGFIEELLPPAERVNSRFNNDGPLLRLFPALRELCIDILQDRRAALSRRLLLLGVLMRELDDRVKGGRLADLEVWLTNKRILAVDPLTWEAVDTLPGNKPLFILNNIQNLQKIDSPIQDFAVHKAIILNHFCLEAAGKNDRTANLKFYIDAEQEFINYFGDISYLFENILVNTVFYTKFPLVNDSDAVWKNFVNLCSLYSFFWFFAICCRPDSREELISSLMMASRALLHNQERTGAIADSLFKNDSATLAHMAILVNG